MRSSSGSFNGEAVSSEGVDGPEESGVVGKTMDKVHESIAWYQKKIGSYDKQLWEQSVEKKLQKSHFLHNAPRKSVRLKTEYIDVDLIRGSTFAKTKPQVPWVYITRKAAARIIFYPFYYTWWVHQTSVQMYFLLLVLYVMQVATTFVYIRNRDNTILEDEMSFTEVILPALLMFLLCIIHSQTVLAHITHKPPKRSKDISRVVRKPKLKKPSRRGHRSSGNNSSACPDDSGADHGGLRRHTPVPSPLTIPSPAPSVASSSSSHKAAPTGLAARISRSDSSNKPRSSDNFAQQISRRSQRTIPAVTSETLGSLSLQESCDNMMTNDCSGCQCDKSEYSSKLKSSEKSSTDQSSLQIYSELSSVQSTDQSSGFSTDQSNTQGSVQSSAEVQTQQHELCSQQVECCNHGNHSIPLNTDLNKAKAGCSVDREVLRKECEDSGCDAVSDSIDPPRDCHKAVRHFSVDSYSGNSDFEIVDHQGLVCKAGGTPPSRDTLPQTSSCKCAVLPAERPASNVSATDLRKQAVCCVVSSSCANSLQNEKQQRSDFCELDACHSQTHPQASGHPQPSLSRIHQELSVSGSVKEPVSSPSVKASPQCHSTPDAHKVPKIVIQQASFPGACVSASKSEPDCLSNSSHTATVTSSSVTCNVPPSSAHKGDSAHKGVVSSLDSTHTDSTQSDSVQNGDVASQDSSHPDSTKLHCFSEMFVQKILDEEALQKQGSGSYLLTTSDLDNSSSSISSSSNSVPSDQLATGAEKNSQKLLSSPLSFPLPLDESLDHASDGERPSDVSNYNPSDSESDDLRNNLRGRCEDRSKRLRFHETVVSGPTARSEQDNITDSRCNLRRRRRISGSAEVTEVKPTLRSRPSSLGLRPHGVKGKHPSSSENETGGAVETPEGSTKAAMSSEEWEDRIQSDETTSSAYTSSCGEGQSDGDEEDRSEYTTSTLHVINLLHPQSGTTNSAGTVSQPDKVSCVIWEGNECKKVDLTALDIGWAIIDKVDSLPESSDYFLIGLFFSLIISCMPLVYRMFGVKSQINWATMSLPVSLYDILSKLYSFAELYSWRQHVVMINGILQRLVLSLIFFFLLSVADRTFKQRLLYAKHFSYLTSSRRARKFSMPHFRLNKVRNIKIWLSLRSYLKRRGPQRSVDVIVSACFMCAVCVVCLISIQMLKDTEVYLVYLCNWELMVWCLALGVFLMRFMTLGLKINKKYRNLSVLITEQINLYLQMEQKPHKKDELILANNVLRLAEDLLKELESPFKISGFSANPLIYNIMRVVVLSAFSAVLTEVLGFKLKLYKIKIKA